MDHSSFLAEALEHLRCINWRIAHTTATDRRALEGARDEIMELMAVSVSKAQAANKVSN
jgi:hypothetical protein